MRGPTATSGHRMSASVSWPTSDYASNDVITICISIAAILPSLLVLFLGIKMEARRARHTQSSQLPRTNVDVLDLVEDLFNHIFSSPTPRSETISILDLLFTEQLLLLQATFAAQHAVDLGHVTHTIYSMIGNFSLALALEMNGTMHDLDIHALTNMLHRSVREARNIQSGGRPDTDLEKLLRDFTPDFIDLLDGDRQPMERHFASGEPFAVCITGGELRDHNSKYQLCLREERTPEEADPGSYLYDLRPLVFSNAYRELKRDLLMLTHELYTERVFAAIGDEARWVTSTKLQPAALRQTAMEIAWTPPGVIKVSPESGFRSFTNQCKVYTEAHLGPSWDWWPLAPREYPFQHGYVRLAWSLPCGTVRHLDVQGIRLDTLLRTFRTAPDFMQSISMRPRGLTISRMLNTYCGLIARFVLSAIIYVATVLVEGSSTRHAVARTSRGPIRSFRGELLSETGDTLPSASTRHQSGALPQEEEAPAGSEDSPKDYQHNDGRLDSPEDSGHGDPPPNTNPNRAGFRFVYLCTKAGRSFRPSCLEGNGRQTDRNFFRDLKNQYKAARGSLRYHLSIWRFSHCEFYRVSLSPSALDAPRDAIVHWDLIDSRQSDSKARHRRLRTI